MQSLKPPQNFTFKPEEWPQWIKQFRRFRNASKLSSEDGVIQRDTLLYVMGEESEKIFETLKFDKVLVGTGADAREEEEKDTDFETLVSKFDAYFLVKRNIIYERSKFQERKQQQSETVEEFYRNLRSLVAHCDYKDTEDQVRDRLVVGLNDCKLKEKLQLIHDLSLERALEVARQHEQIKAQMRQQAEGLSVSSASSDETTKGRGRNRFRYSTGGSTSCSAVRGRDRGQSHVDTKHQASKCGRCGYDHKEKMCPANGQKCRRCNKRGHFSRVCNSVRELEQNYEEDEVDSPTTDEETEGKEDYVLDSVITDNTQPWITTLKVKGTDVKFKIDTGADVTIMNEATYEKFKHKPKLSSTHISLTSPGGKMTTRGEFFAKTSLKGKTFKFRVFVVRNRTGNNLLSRNVAVKMGLVKRLDEVHENVFGTIGLLKTDPVSIKMKPDVQPYCVTTARRVPFPLQKKVKAELERMKSAGIIQEVEEPTDWCAPMVPVVKLNGSIRICVDFKRLNEGVKRPHCMLPNLEDISPKMTGATLFSTLDASSGFFQVPLDEKSMHLTTFITPMGRYCFKRVPMGISLGPEVFQTKMKKLLEGLDGCDAIMDDTIVYGKTEEEHDQRLSAVLNRINESGLKLNKEKCQFKKAEVKFFGNIISGDGVRPDPEKVKAIKDMPPPRSVTELRTVCGMFNYLSKFVSGMATVMKPITDLMKKDTAYCWGPAQHQAFELIKQKLSASTVLGFYSAERKTVVSADSSSYGLGAALLQWQGDKLLPIAYASRTLTEAEKRYAQIEKECLASTWACEKFAKYLIGLDSFELQTDHKPLVPLISNKDIDKAPVRCQRLLIRLLRFNAQVVHVPGKQLIIADALSRSPVPHTPEDEEKADSVTAYVDSVQCSWPITANRLSKLRAGTVHDPELKQVIDYVCNGWPTAAVSQNLRAYQQAQGELSLVDGLLAYGNRVVVPKAQRGEILHKLHETHQGLHKCRLNAQSCVWWPGLSGDLKNLVDSCQQCRANRPAQCNEPLRPTLLPERPWQQLGADLCSYEGREHLVVVDYYSRWLEVIPLTSTTAVVIIKKLTQLFATHGVPEVMMTDNGPQFYCEEFQNFARDFDFQHRTSSPGFPQANGEAESAVKVAKKLLQQRSLEVALLNYRSTPHSSTGVSPAVALMGRPLKTKVPRFPITLIPCPVNDEDLRRTDQKAKDVYKGSYDRRHGARPLPHLKPGDNVLIKTDAESSWSKHGTIVASDPENRTYLVNSPAGVLRRNRKHLQTVPSSPRKLFTSDQYVTSTALSESKDIGDSKDIVFSNSGDSKADVSPEPELRRVTRACTGFTAPKPLRFREEG